MKVMSSHVEGEDPVVGEEGPAAARGLGDICRQGAVEAKQRVRV